MTPLELPVYTLDDFTVSIPTTLLLVLLNTVLPVSLIPLNTVLLVSLIPLNTSLLLDYRILLMCVRTLDV